MRALRTPHAPPSGESLPSLLAGVVSGAAAREFPAMLSVWAAQAAGQLTSLTWDAGACWLGLYLSAKIIDDVQDGEAGLFPAHIPSPMRINLALALLFSGQLCLAGQPQCPDSRERLALLAVTIAHSLEITQGQQFGLQPWHEGREPLGWAWWHAGEKGGRPLALACRLGAMSVAAASPVVDGLACYGQCVGEAVQAIDDAMDLVELRANDLVHGQSSLAVAYAFDVADQADRSDLTMLLDGIREGVAGALSATRDKLLAMGAARYLSVEATARVLRARGILEELNDALQPEGKALLWRATELLLPASAGG